MYLNDKFREIIQIDEKEFKKKIIIGGERNEISNLQR